MTLRSLAAVAVGGLAGTAARLAIDTLLPHIRDGFPWSTLLVNLLGSLLLGFLLARVWPVAPEWVRAGLGAGVLGSFTTFSAVAVALLELPLPVAALYLGATVLLGLAGALLGLRLGRRLEADSSAPSIDAVNE